MKHPANVMSRLRLARPLLVWATMFLAIAGVSLQAAESIQVIVHSSVKVRGLTKLEASNLLLKRTSKWSDGTAVSPVDHGDSSIFEAFCSAIHGRSSTSIRSYWQRQIFAGRGVPPSRLDTDQAILDYVESTPGAIGYVSAKADFKNRSVKRIPVR